MGVTKFIDEYSTKMLSIHIYEFFLKPSFSVLDGGVTTST